MKRALQKLVRNGNATHVALARPLLIDVGFLPGDLVVVESPGDGTLVVRKHTLDDRETSRVSGMIPERPVSAQP